MAYESGWSSIVELEQGQSVSNKFNSAFANIDTALAVVETNEQKIAVLEGATFSFNSNDGLVVSNDVYDDAVSVTHIISAPIGIVMYGYSLTFSGTVNDKLYIEMTVPNVDGTAGIPFEHVFEIKDSAEVRPKYYAFPRTHTGAITAQEVKLRFRIKAGDADITVNFIDLMSEIKN